MMLSRDRRRREADRAANILSKPICCVFQADEDKFLVTAIELREVLGHTHYNLANAAGGFRIGDSRFNRDESFFHP